MHHPSIAHTVACALVSCAAGLLTPAIAGPAEDDAARSRMVEDQAALRFDRLGHPVLQWDAVAPVTAAADRPHLLLVLPVAFPDRAFERFAGEPDQSARLVQHYQRLLFDPASKRAHTLSHFYRQQSMGLYHLQGVVVPPVVLERPRAAYGGPIRPVGGDWRTDADAQGLAIEALTQAVAAEPNRDWSDFDRWDPHDVDGDGLRAEPDGYVDHLVLVYAGGGEASCYGLHKLSQVFTPDATPAVLEGLSPEARACAERIWPHRFVLQRGEGDGPMVEGRRNARGGVPLREGLWVRDYNMQSEFIDVSTFAHEFGHSLGLPDVYARSTSNSTGPWSLMSATADPTPQNLNAWSRIQLGWLRPKVILPPAHGGRRVQSVYLRTLDDPADPPQTARALQAAGVWRAAMVVLPPRMRTIRLTTLPSSGGALALYSGQGNSLDRRAEVRVDLSAAKGPVRLRFDGWWSIEAGWDFAYLETSVDDGRTWTRRRPTDKGVMPARHGHDGPKSLPGFTGLSGDRDGDGKNESRRGCDPKAALAHGEDRVGAARNPCLEPSWVPIEFALDDLAGQRARIRLRYVTDMAAVLPGMMIDRVQLVAGAGAAARSVLEDDFEGALTPGWRLDGFSLSSGSHRFPVPHAYILEYRDPYAEGPAGYTRYDRALTRNSWRFYRAPGETQMRAVQVRPRPGVVAWYADGTWPWSENDPADNGPGRGFLLAVDAWPNELSLPGLESALVGDPAAFDTGYAIADGRWQAELAEAWKATVCFVRGAEWRPAKPDAGCAASAAGLDAARGGGLLALDGRPLMYSYQRLNTLLPGPDRARYAVAGEMLDYRMRQGQPQWRLRARSLRYLHTLDAPFALEPFADGVRHAVVRDGQLEVVRADAHPAVRVFDDDTPRRWANPRLRFGGVAVPPEGFGFELARPAPHAPRPARVKVYFTWER